MDIMTVLNFAKEMIATILVLLTMWSPAFGTSTAVPYRAENPDELVASFAAVSDVHIETNRVQTFKNYKAVLEGIKAAEDVDAAIFTGDNVMNGQITENFFFYLGLRGVMPAEKNYVVMGNHDIGNGTGVYLEHKNNFITNNRLFLGNLVNDGYYYRVENGCYLVFLSLEEITVGESVMSPEQLAWLKGVLDEAASKNAPIIVFNHHPIDWFKGTEGSDFTSTTLAELLNDYNNLLYIHGHWHRKLEAGSFDKHYGVNCINLPRCTEATEYEPGDGIIIEVYENKFVVRARNFIKGEWLDEFRYEYDIVK